MWLQKTTKEAMRHGDWKLVRDKAGTPYELYNLKWDIGETTNLASMHPDKVEELINLMDAERTKNKRFKL